MPDNSVKISLEALDKTQTAFKALIDSFTHLQKEINNTEGTSKKSALSISSLFQTLKSNWLEFTAGIASVYGLTKGFQSFVDEAARAEQVQSRLAFATQSVGYAWKEAKLVVDEFADSIRRTTRFSDEQARDALTQMLLYTNNYGEALEASRIAMDMSIRTNMDLSTATRLVGMAIGGNVEILGKVLPQFKDLDRVLGENATMAEKAAFAWKIFREVFSGASAADMDTYAAKVARFNNEWKQLKETLGTSLLPVVNTLLERMTALTKAAQLTFGGGTEKQRLEAQIKTLETELLGLQAEQPFVSEKAQLEILKKIETAKVRILAIDDELFVAAEKIREESAKAAEEQFRVTPPEKDWIKKWVEQFDALKYSFEQLGIESQESLTRAAAAAVRYMEQIKKALGEGKASADDYKAALNAAASAMQKLVAPDITKALVDLQTEYEEGAKAISRDDPEFRKKIEAWAWQINEKQKQIIGQTTGELEQQVRDLQARLPQLTLEPKVDAESARQEMKNFKSWIDDLKREIESGAIMIKVKVDKTELEGLRSQAETPVESQVDFYGTGSSKRPLSEKIQEIINQFGSMDQALSGMGAMINFSELTKQMEEQENVLDKIAEWYHYYEGLHSQYPTVSLINGPWLDPNVTKQLEQWKSDALSQMGILQMKQIMELIQGFGQGEFQAGGTVPRTGFYRLHKGEEVRTTNQVSMSSGPFNFYISGGDARENARQFEKILRYRLSGDLRDAIKNIH